MELNRQFKLWAQNYYFLETFMSEKTVLPTNEILNDQFLKILMNPIITEVIVTSKHDDVMCSCTRGPSFGRMIPRHEPNEPTGNCPEICM